MPGAAQLGREWQLLDMLGLCRSSRFFVVCVGCGTWIGDWQHKMCAGIAWQAVMLVCCVRMGLLNDSSGRTSAAAVAYLRGSCLALPNHDVTGS
jgi:hypothetical protein